MTTATVSPPTVSPHAHISPALNVLDKFTADLKAAQQEFNDSAQAVTDTEAAHRDARARHAVAKQRLRSFGRAAEKLVAGEVDATPDASDAT